MLSEAASGINKFNLIMAATSQCLIWKHPSIPYFRATVLGKYDVQYFCCTKCDFIQTESPYWLDEAYDSAITKLDIGLVARNESTVPIVQATINQWFNPSGKFIDYGGGYGMLVRMMRDRGFDYYRQDIHCENLFAQSFDINDVPPFKAILLTAFEVFEHLTDPIAEVEKMLTYSDSILFSTAVQPTKQVTPDNWWYVGPETGQHIALYSRNSLYKLAEHFKLNYYRNERDIHLFTPMTLSNRMFQLITHPRWSKWYNRAKPGRATLLSSDFTTVRQKLKNVLANSL